MDYVYLALAAAGSAYALWFFFLAVMALERARQAKTLTQTAYYLGLPIAIGGIVIDIAVNVVFLTPLFMELPEEWTVSERLTRHSLTGSGWRQKFAKWVCANLLDTFDPTGTHCDCE